MLKTVSEAMEWTRLGRTKLYDEINSGRLRSIKVGSRRLIPAGALADWVEHYAGGSDRPNRSGSESDQIGGVSR